MDRATRDKFVALTDQATLAYGASACLETPKALFDKLYAEFKFGIDLTANEHNHLLPDWVGPGIGARASDALTADWQSLSMNPVGFSNPPYGAFIKLILQKAIDEAVGGFTSVLLLPLRAAGTKTGWYVNLVLPFADEVRHLPRVTFSYQGKPKTDAKGRPVTALFDSIVVVYRPPPGVKRHGCCPHFSVWDWRWPVR